MHDVAHVYVGVDSREIVASEVCRHSVIRRSSIPVCTTPLLIQALRYNRLFWRESFERDGQRFDKADGKPFSTEFSFTRFLVPVLMQHQGWALFCDCDFLFRADIAEVFRQADPSYAVMCVKHVHEPDLSTGGGLKMDGVQQTRYRRKNWSSFVLWNCAHPAHRALSLKAVNEQPGSWLHAFEWLSDREIGALDPAWNWLCGYSPTTTEPKAVHFTEGGPWFAATRDVAFANEWRAELAHLMRSR